MTISGIEINPTPNIIHNTILYLFLKNSFIINSYTKYKAIIAISAIINKTIYITLLLLFAKEKATKAVTIKPNTYDIILQMSDIFGNITPVTILARINKIAMYAII